MSDPSAPSAGVRTLVDKLLEEQRSLTAVERFSQKHDRHDLPAQAKYYRDLIPLEKPHAGQQYAFAVDLDSCTGCKACVTACHSLNGLDEDEIWRTVGVLYSEDLCEPFHQTVTSACHHCVDPGCLEGCPVLAYEKDAETGIVKHLDDQCIGCQYCTLKCPYDVPKYSKKKGIVRKCDMCSSRLAVGEAPACVQSCPNQAIRIEVVEKAEVLQRSVPGAHIVPGAFDSSYTKPTTSYRRKAGVPPHVRPGASHMGLEHAHWPLILMLLFTQMGAGLFLVQAAISYFGAAELALATGVAGCVALYVGLGLSVLHLGRPLGAWRFFLGLKTSWMSREILAFGILSLASMLSCAGGVLEWGMRMGWIPIFPIPPSLPACVPAALGVVAVFTSAMIYIDTRRPFWAGPFTLLRFYGAVLSLGLMAAWCVSAWLQMFVPSAPGSRAFPGCLSVLVVGIGVVAIEGVLLRHGLRHPESEVHASALRIWTRSRRNVVMSRFVLAMTSVMFCAIGVLQHGLGLAIALTVALATAFSGQVIERYFFFTAVTAPRMPGNIELSHEISG